MEIDYFLSLITRHQRKAQDAHRLAGGTREGKLPSYQLPNVKCFHFSQKTVTLLTLLSSAGQCSSKECFSEEKGNIKNTCGCGYILLCYVSLCTSSVVPFSHPFNSSTSALWLSSVPCLFLMFNLHLLPLSLCLPGLYFAFDLYFI